MTPMPCNCCEITDKAFSESEARSALLRYRKRGPAPHTRAMLQAIRSRRLKDATLLDVGGGVGTIHQELLQDTVRQATHVDASTAYLKAAEAEASRRGNSSAVEFIHADFTDVATRLPPADIVTLDRVVCCYPDYRALLTAAASRTTALLGLSYPRETWYTRFFIKVLNVIQSVRRDPFRAFVHPVAEMDSLLNAHGLHRVSVKRFLIWEVVLYHRAAA